MRTPGSSPVKSPSRSPLRSPLRRRSALAGKSVNIRTLTRSQSSSRSLKKSNSGSPLKKSAETLGNISPLRRSLTYSRSASLSRTPSPQKANPVTTTNNNSNNIVHLQQPFTFFEESEDIRAKVLEQYFSRLPANLNYPLEDVENVDPAGNCDKGEPLENTFPVNHNILTELRGKEYTGSITNPSTNETFLLVNEMHEDENEEDYDTDDNSTTNSN